MNIVIFTTSSSPPSNKNQNQAPGNAGLWDQLAALQWVQILFSNQTQMKYYDTKIQIQKNTSLVPFQVQENIAAFGGDPGKVNDIR